MQALIIDWNLQLSSIGFIIRLTLYSIYINFFLVILNFIYFIKKYFGEDDKFNNNFGEVNINFFGFDNHFEVNIKLLINKFIKFNNILNFVKSI